ncbi:MAG: carboxylating nicotinate-nucleotide diphosphorylase [Deltaproteobacteria bacterium]|nr:carboxylating nicotinate-nucleotide diphosphorylase [Deltaproteobacteria bacterium]
MKSLIRDALNEDRAKQDITSRAIFGRGGPRRTGFLLAKENLVLSGLDVARDVFTAVSRKTRVISGYSNGARVKKGERLARVEGNIADLLSAERVALNFLQHLSGVATLTRKFVEEIRPCRAAILDTRKTTPGLRGLEKRAVLHGGGKNHRMNLSDQFLIKDNHIEAAGGIRQAVRQVKKVVRGKLIEIEAKNLREVAAALDEGVDIILLDNMSLAQIKKAVKIVRGRCTLEVSGGVNLKNVRKIAKTGVDRISIGFLTHSAPAVDISFEII